MTFLLKRLTKPALWLVAMGAIFMAGMFYQSKRQAQDLVELERERIAAITKRDAEIRAEYQETLERESAARIGLQSDLATLRAREQSLLDRVANLPPVRTIVTEVPGECSSLSNPFSLDFISLWNDAGRSSAD